MKQNRIAIWIDLLFCLVIMPLIIMLVPVDKWIVHHTAFTLTLIAYLYALYFIYRKTHFPSLFIRRRYWLILLLVLLLLGATQLLADFPLPESDSPLTLKFRKHLRAQTVWFFFLIVTGFSLSLELSSELFRQILRRQEIEAEKNKAELALYKAQINPHFLFNTLNTLYGLVLTRSEHTESAFVKFSNILRYMYAQATTETIALSSEIDYIRQYIDLQSLRLNRHTQVVFESHADNPSIQVPPLILITFVENAFKYGASPERDCTVLIRVNAENGLLLFETENAVMRTKTENAPGIGIENCRKRLELLYPGRFALETSEKEGIFRTRLTIRLQ